MFKKYQTAIEKIRGLENSLDTEEKKISEIRARVRSGEQIVSKLPYENFLFAWLGYNEANWSKVLDLKEQVISSPGSEILVEQKTRTDCGPQVHSAHGNKGFEQDRFMPPHRNTYEEINSFYGILSGEDLDYNIGEGAIIFPLVGGHVNLKGRDFRFNLDPVNLEGQLKIKLEYLPNLTNRPSDLSDFLGIHKSSETTSRILFGSDVAKYFEKFSNGSEVYNSSKKHASQKDSH